MEAHNGLMTFPAKVYQSRTWPKASGLSPACAFWVLILIWWMGRWDTTLAGPAGRNAVCTIWDHNQAGLVQSNSCEAAGPSCTGPLAFLPPCLRPQNFSESGSLYDEQDGSTKLYTLRVSNPYLLSPNGVSRCIVWGLGSEIKLFGFKSQP